MRIDGVAVTVSSATPPQPGQAPGHWRRRTTPFSPRRAVAPDGPLGGFSSGVLPSPVRCKTWIRLLPIPHQVTHRRAYHACPERPTYRPEHGIPGIEVVVGEGLRSGRVPVQARQRPANRIADPLSPSQALGVWERGENAGRPARGRDWPGRSRRSARLRTTLFPRTGPPRPPEW